MGPAKDLRQYQLNYGGRTLRLRYVPSSSGRPMWAGAGPRADSVLLGLTYLETPLMSFYSWFPCFYFYKTRGCQMAWNGWTHENLVLRTHQVGASARRAPPPLETRQAGRRGRGAAHLIGNRPTAAAWLLPVRRPADMDGKGDNLMLLGERRGN